MLLGIDVGGTFTDAVLINGNQVIAYSKQATSHEDLLQGIFAAIDAVMVSQASRLIERVALSTTIVTNALVEGKTDPVGLVIIPGPGLDITPYVPDTPIVIEGYTDHRGRVRAAMQEQEIADACRLFKEKTVVAVSAKFAVRNPAQEQKAVELLKQYAPDKPIIAASEVSGSLNFIRRTNSAYFNGAVWRRFNSFADAVEKALIARGISAPAYILKADGGTMPFSVARCRPVEAVFTGPAASVLGITALCSLQDDAVSIDIGGTTTDITLWQGGIPLFAEKGATIGRFATSVRAFLLRSVGIGGDSWVRREAGQIAVGPQRRGPAMAAGGEAPTVTDAMVVAGLISFGDSERARKAMAAVANNDQEPEAAAREVLTAASETIVNAIKEMIRYQYEQPVYTVSDIIHAQPLKPATLIGVGGAARGLAPIVAERIAAKCVIPQMGDVANAIGAALAKPTMALTFRADTDQGYYAIAETGKKEKLSSRRFTLDEARQITTLELVNRAEEVGIHAGQVESVYEEEFNLVRGFQTTGKIITCKMQLKPGVLTSVG